MDTQVQSRASERWIIAALIVGFVIGIIHWSAQIRCLFYPECNPLLSVPEAPPWNMPTDSQERAAYDLAHSLKVPSSAPKPVPFDFKTARMAELGGGKSVAQQYFEHLCRTEDGEYIARRVKDVDGFLLMRPRDKTEGTQADSDRYGTEEPVGFGWFSDDDQLNGEPKHDPLGSTYIQPMYGVYVYVEYVKPGDPTKIVRVGRPTQGDPRDWPASEYGNWRSKTSGQIYVPYVTSRIETDHISARYAYTWRGLRRPRDREFGIAGGEFFLVDRLTNEVLAMKRTFNSTYLPSNPNFTRWSAARDCRRVDLSAPLNWFVIKVLIPDLHVNDQFVPVSELGNYHQFLKNNIETAYAH